MALRAQTYATRLVMSRRLGYAKDTFSTPSHDLHRPRRKALSPLFTPTKINLLYPAILSHINQLCLPVAKYQGEKEVLPLKRAWFALTTDIITEYEFEKSYNQLDSKDFEESERFNRGYMAISSFEPIL
jgi:cytochrome P450